VDAEKRADAGERCEPCGGLASQARVEPGECVLGPRAQDARHRDSSGDPRCSVAEDADLTAKAQRIALGGRCGIDARLSSDMPCVDGLFGHSRQLVVAVGFFVLGCVLGIIHRPTGTAAPAAGASDQSEQKPSAEHVQRASQFRDTRQDGSKGRASVKAGGNYQNRGITASEVPAAQ